MQVAWLFEGNVVRGPQRVDDGGDLPRWPVVVLDRGDRGRHGTAGLCSERELHPLAVRRHDVALWARQLANPPQRSGKAEAPASIARRLSCLSSF